MTQQAATNEARHQEAMAAWTALPHGGHDAVRLHVHCARGHHLAVVYDTAGGPVVVTSIRARSHGSRDRVDQPHGDHTAGHFVDFLVEPAVTEDDPVPAWCDCGHRTLSRVAVADWVSAGERRVTVD